MIYRKYQHLERFGTSEVNGIELGKCYIFPKLDGTNASVWLGEDGEVKAGSRNRELTLESDNAGFYNSIIKDDKIRAFFDAYPNMTLYGEWLVPHSLKTYREDTWRKFYVFDVVDSVGNHIQYSWYKDMLDMFGVEYITPIAIVTNPTYEDLIKYLESNTYLIEDGKGAGEGIVIKNYDFKNQYGRTVWAKIVRTEFKELYSKEMGSPEKENKLVEEEIVNQYCTSALIDKVYDKISLENSGFGSRNIPQLLNTVFYDLVREETWNFVKDKKNPTVNFNILKHCVIQKVKSHKKELF